MATFIRLKKTDSACILFAYTLKVYYAILYACHLAQNCFSSVANPEHCNDSPQPPSYLGLNVLEGMFCGHLFLWYQARAKTSAPLQIRPPPQWPLCYDCFTISQSYCHRCVFRISIGTLPTCLLDKTGAKSKPSYRPFIGSAWICNISLVLIF